MTVGRSLSIKFEVRIDECVDNSLLGTAARRHEKGRFYFDRKAGKMYDDYFNLEYANLELDCFYNEETGVFDIARFNDAYRLENIVPNCVNPNDFVEDGVFNDSAFGMELEQHVDLEEIRHEFACVGEMSTRYERHQYEFITDFEHKGLGPEREARFEKPTPEMLAKHTPKEIELLKTFTPEEIERMKKFDMVIKSWDYRTTSFWLDALYCLEDAKRLEGYGDDWYGVIVSAEVTDEEGTVHGSCAMSGESDYNKSERLELYQNVGNEALEEARRYFGDDQGDKDRIESIQMLTDWVDTLDESDVDFDTE